MSEIDLTIYTCIVKPWGNDPPVVVGGITFNGRTPHSAVHERYGERITITDMRIWPEGTLLPDAMAQVEREFNERHNGVPNPQGF